MMAKLVIKNIGLVLAIAGLSLILVAMVFPFFAHFIFKEEDLGGAQWASIALAVNSLLLVLVGLGLVAISWIGSRLKR